MSIIKTPSFELAVYQQGDLKAKKLALLLPGKLDTKDYPHMRGHVDFLASRGYLAVAFDPPGTWESPGDTRLYTMTNYLKAINELITYFGNKPTVLIGHSRGGSVGLISGSRNKNVTHIAAIMSHDHPSPMPSKDKAQGFHISTRDTPNGEKITFKLLEIYYTDALQYNLIKEISTCKKPKLFILGKKDTTVKPAEVKEIYEQSAQPKELIEVNSDHDYRRHPEIIREINQLLINFLR